MKKIAAIFFLILILTFMTSCATKREPETTAQIVVDSSIPQAVFASEEIKDAFLDYNIGLVDDEAEWVISFEEIDESLGEQAYQINVSADREISITGGDTTGLMYGGLEVAEQIRLSGGIEGVKESSGSPDIINRGIKFNAPLDMRTPSYSDAGDAAQNNIENMWDMDFWKAQFDAMAKNRLNMFSLWNLNPFPSMVEVPEFPDVALDDVWRTTLKFDDTYNGTATNMVREEHWGNYEVIKEISIEEKIEFWREVMKYAHDRGVKFYIVTWNIYTYGENGKYGITSDVDNETTREYYRTSVQEMLRTYPNLDGIGVAAGENMDWAPGMETLNEQWLWDTYGRGINKILAEQPDRDFTLIHRLHLSEFDLINDIWKDFTGTLDFSDKYSIAHMYSYTNPTFSEPILEAMPGGDRIWLELRNDDFYYYRWGDPDFARDYLTGMPGELQLRGFMMGSDGYILGREYAVVDPELQGQLYIQKNWYSYSLWGRLGYDQSLSNDFFEDLVAEHFGGVAERADCEKLAQSMEVAGKIIPQVNRLFWHNGDSYCPEFCLSEPKSFGFMDIKRWLNSSNVLADAGVMSIADYVHSVVEGTDGETDLQTPPEVVVALQEYANATLALVEEVHSNAPPEIKTLEQKEFYGMLADQEAMALLGLYYSEKISGAVELRLYNDTKDESYKKTAIEHLEKALEYWKQYAAIFAEQYLPQQFGRLFTYVDPVELTEDVEKDISIAQKWKPRKY